MWRWLNGVENKAGLKKMKGGRGNNKKRAFHSCPFK